MKIYVLVAKNEEGKKTLNMPTTFGRRIRAYPSLRRAQVYAEQFECDVVEVDLDEGKVYESSNI